MKAVWLACNIGQEHPEEDGRFSRPIIAKRMPDTDHLRTEHTLDIGDGSRELPLLGKSPRNDHKPIISRLDDIEVAASNRWGGNRAQAIIS